MRIPHPHLYKLVFDKNDYNWGGVVCRLKLWKCRFCSAKKRQVSVSM